MIFRFSLGWESGNVEVFVILFYIYSTDMKYKFLISFLCLQQTIHNCISFIHFIVLYSSYYRLQLFCYSLQSRNSRIQHQQQWIPSEQTNLPHCLQFIKKRVDSFQIAFSSFLGATSYSSFQLLETHRSWIAGFILHSPAVTMTYD